MILRTPRENWRRPILQSGVNASVCQKESAEIPFVPFWTFTWCGCVMIDILDTL